jgi:hypothetical protein
MKRWILPLMTKYLLEGVCPAAEAFTPLDEFFIHSIYTRESRQGSLFLPVSVHFFRAETER